jgi:hypothetical protein
MRRLIEEADESFIVGLLSVFQVVGRRAESAFALARAGVV